MWNTLFAYLTAGAVVTMVAVLPSRTTAAATRSAWYRCIRPSLTPPSVVFPIVWTALYILIAISLAHVFLLPASLGKHLLLLAFAINLALNMVWSFLYFGSRNIRGALAVIVLLLLTTVWIVMESYRLHAKRWKAHILVPYLAWLCFATVLNAMSVAKEKECSSIL